LYQQFRETAQRQPQVPAVLGPRDGDALTYGELDRAICEQGDRLAASGVKPGDCLGLHYPSTTGYIIHTYAAWRCGASVVPLAPELAAAEKSEICRCLAIDFVISSRPPAFLEPLRRGQAAPLGRDVLIPVQSPRRHPPGFDPTSCAFIRFTSGTTGTSKGVVLSHRTIDERIRAANVRLAIGPGDRVLWVLSMSYHFAVSIVAYLTFGATIVLPPNNFAAAIVGSIRQHNATLLYASPTHYALLAEYPEAHPLPSLRLAISTTSALDITTAARFAQRYEWPISQALGIIEVGLPCIDTDPDPRRPGSVGPVLPPYRVRLADIGLGGEHQAILLAGPGMLDAYYDPWQPRDEILDDGWFRTGDVGSVDENGRLFLRGRSHDVISVMGMKFFPQEVERVLAAHPQVEAASVVSSRDDRWGQSVVARVVVKSGRGHAGLERELAQLCRQQLAAYKVPGRIEFVRQLARTASGKVLHRAG
jgi:long-chain acyl-CoA synthetase